VTGARVAAAPCSGFHHAGYRSAGAFCTFNGLMVTAATLRATGLARKVGILDCDMHYGDGTDDIIDVLGAGDWVTHWTAGRTFWARAHVRHFFAALNDAIESMRGCDVVLYQAGADPHVDDPLGGMLTTEELAERDARVFTALAAMKVPVVWNLAGGYQRDQEGGIAPVLAIHDHTMRACARVYG
jgi:acetoin utilization deacetylase AcuC-like enzyme